MFAFTDKPTSYDHLDKCIDDSREGELFSIAQLLKGQPLISAKRRKTAHLKPVAIVRFNTKLGKAKPATVLALLDSGGAESIISDKIASKLRVRTSNGPPKVWSTPNGDLSTNRKTKSQFKLSELHDDRVVEWDFHVTKTLGAYDMILGRDLLEFLGIDILFSDKVIIQWDSATMPFKDATSG